MNSGFGIAKLVAVLGVTISAILSPISGAYAAPAQTPSILASPAGADLNPDQTRQHFDYSMAPGQSSSDNLYLANVGNVTTDVLVYARDAITMPSGDFALGSLTDTPKDAATWVKFGTAQKATYKVRLAVGERLKVPFTVTTPATAQPGDHTAGILVSYGGTKGQLNIVSRIGIRLYARVAGAIQPSLQISDVHSEYIDQLWSPTSSTLRVSFNLKNSGNVALGAAVQVVPNGIFSNQLGVPGGIKIDEILPGYLQQVTVEVPNIGQWMAFHSQINVQPTVQSASLVKSQINPFSRDTWAFSWPSAWTTILVALLVGLIGWRIRNSRLKAKTQAWLAYTEAEAERKARLKLDGDGKP